MGTRIGDLGVEIAEMKNDLGDTQEALIADRKFLENLEENCEKKKKEWDVIVKTRAEELAALADTIKVLKRRCVGAVQKDIAKRCKFFAGSGRCSRSACNSIG